MPTVLRLEGYRFFFYSRENNEPSHIHVEMGDALAKFWLDPVELASSKRFRAHELGVIRQMVLEYQPTFMGAWNDYFNAGE